MSAATNVIEGYVRQLETILAEAEWYCHLYTNDPPITPELTLSEITEAVFDGYAPALMRRWTPVSLRRGRAFSQPDTVAWRYNGGPPPDPIRGVYVTSGQLPILLAVWRLPGEAFTYDEVGDLLRVGPAVYFPSVPGA